MSIPKYQVHGKFPSSADGNVFYVNMTPISESEAKSDKTFEEITEAHNSGKNVKCKLDTYVLPLCFITNVQVIFGGATSNLTTFVTQYSNNTVEHSVAELAFKSVVPTIEEFNSLANQVENLSSGESGGIEKLMDVTTTEPTKEFQIPIDTEEMANKLLNASELHLYLYVPRDAEDTETNTSGNVSVGVPVTESYRPAFASFQGAIPNPTLDYMRLSTSIAKIFVDTFGGSMERNAIGMQYKYVVGAGESSSLYHVTVDARGFKKDSYIFVNGTQNMAASTRFVLGVRA